MANGLLNSVDLTSTANTIVYTAPNTSGTQVAAKIFVCNRNNASIRVRLGLGLSGETVVSTSNAIEYDVIIPPFGVIERGNIMLGQNQRIIARSDTVSVSVSVCGVEN
jgi:hypothetical protein